MSGLAWLCIGIAVVIVQFALGVGIGRAADLRDRRTPSAPAGGAGTGKVPPARRAHLWLVR